MTRILLFASFLLIAVTGIAQNKTDAQGRKQGPWSKNHPNGQKRYEGQFINDKPTGTFTYYDPSGKLSNTVQHVGNDVSYAKSFNAAGTVVSEGKYIGQQKDSVWNFYNEQGKLLSAETYVKGDKTGIQKVFYSNGTLSTEQHYLKGKLDGAVISYFENGKTQSENHFVNDQISGVSKTYYLNGTLKDEGPYLAAMRNGVWKYYNEDGSLRQEIEYKNDVIVREKRVNGQFEEFFDTELPKAAYQYKNGKLDGPFFEYQDGGSWDYVEKKDRRSEETNTYRVPKNHKLKRKGSYLNGQLNGKIEVYGPNGFVVKTENYVNGELK
ncbi:MAG: hypothetical protein V4616_08990 [Bacteroidota bacterium]